MLENFSFDKKNTSIIVIVKLPNDNDFEIQSSTEELKLLAYTLGFSVKEIFIQNRTRIEPDYFIGKGKVDELKEHIISNNIDAVLFDNELTGVQERNLEKILNTTIFGRTEIILNIFNRRAKTTEAKLQVQLASLEYMLPRLRNRWDHFSRVEGGIGMRGGEGEKQLELDKRMVKDQMTKIKDKLKKVDVQMKNRRKNRDGSNLVSLVGYTNAGKTTLINILAKTELFAENMLFSTLDSTVKRVYINDNLTILLNDTVGFIKKLPHSLVASFQSTLDEIVNSRLLLHVIDASSVNIKNNIDSVNKVLEEIGALKVPTVRIFNKIDLLQNGIMDIIEEKKENDIYICAKNKSGIDELKNKIALFFEE